jgi:predicted MFS family arabinose efflux permease
LIKLTDQTQLSPIERRATISIASVFGFRMLGLFMILPVVAVATRDYHDFSPLLLGLVIGAYGFTQALLQIPLGLLSDRLGRRPVLVGGLLMFVLGSLVAAWSETMWGLFVGRALQGTGAIASTLMAMAADLTVEDNRSKVMAAIGGSIGFSFILAMMAGPFINQYYGLSGIFWLTAALGVVAIFVVIKVIPQPARACFNREATVDVRQITNLLKDQNLQRLNVGIFILHFALMAVFLLLPDLLQIHIGVDDKNLPWAYLMLLGGGFFLMLPIMILAEKYRLQRVALLGAILILALTSLLIVVTKSPNVLLILLTAFFAAFNLLEALLPSWVSKVCPVGNRGTAMGVYSSSQFFGAFMGGLVGGFCLQYFGANGVYFAISVVALMWLFFSIGLQSPRPLKTLVFSVAERNQQDFLKIISNVQGVKDILFEKDEAFAYVQIDQSEIDMQRLQSYLNRE